ncbi:hypothetical protein BD410DRAFT_783813 [Rickenella mellea]|uniref:Uncharacterized protein n=1 Tax=Rickenella mellea TaxID=50990 RepID=A0A4Y7QIN3_9AGAM|nr:hypothetical protein BD410DRAFT_783813 [Rickenella mellea]
MSPTGPAQKLRKSQTFSEGTGHAVSLACLQCGISPSTGLKCALPGLETSGAQLRPLNSYPPSPAAPQHCGENARNTNYMPESTTGIPQVSHPDTGDETTPFQPKIEKHGSTPCKADPSKILLACSPFLDKTLLERFRLAYYGANFTDYKCIYGKAKSITAYLGCNYQRCESFVNHVDVLCRYLESRNGVDTRITDIVDALRVTPGWPYVSEDDEVTQAWNLVYVLLNLAVDITPVDMSCTTIQEQIRTLFPPTPRHATQHNFKTTLSDILRVGLKVKRTPYFIEHLKIEKDGNDVTVRLLGTSPIMAGIHRSYFHNRTAKALHMEGWMKEIIGSTFVLFGKKPYNKVAADHKLYAYGDRDDVYKMTSLFREFGHTPPNFLAQRAMDLEKLIQSRQAFWPTLRRDLRRQRKEQPFTFWGTIFALFFGICTVIQTVASVWALVPTVQGDNAQESQMIPGNVVNGMRILGSPWLTCMNNEQSMSTTKGNATISCLLQIGVQ